RAEVVDRIDAAAGNQRPVVRKDRYLDVILKVAQVGVRGCQGIAGGRVEHGRPGWRPFPAAPEHEGILFPPCAQRRDAEGVDAALAQLFVALQVRVEDASTADNTNADHLCTLTPSLSPHCAPWPRRSRYRSGGSSGVASPTIRSLRHYG